jgi:hypothetical protein
MTVRAPGGPVNRFRVADAQFSFADGNVPGARAVGRARGDLDFLFPAFTKFRGFDVEVDRFDLETMQFVNPTFPLLDGWISGRATLDSVWTDIRLRNADITHHFADGTPSRMTGGGRVTIGEKFLTYDLALEAQPISLATIARAWPELELEFRGDLFGPVRVQGASDDLAVVADVRGAPGAFAYDGRVDLDSIGGTGYQGTLRFAGLDLRALYDTSSMPVTSLNGTAEVAIIGDSLPNYEGRLDVVLQRSMIDTTRLYDDSHARLRFHDGILTVDTLAVTSVIGTLTGKGSWSARRPQRLAPTVLPGRFAGCLASISAQGRCGQRPRESINQDSLFAIVTAAPVTLYGSIDSLDVRGIVDFRAWTPTRRVPSASPRTCAGGRWHHAGAWNGLHHRGHHSRRWRGAGERRPGRRRSEQGFRRRLASRDTDQRADDQRPRLRRVCAGHVAPRHVGSPHRSGGS